MLNYVQKITFTIIAIFLFSVIFPSALTSSYHSIVYAAVITCNSSEGPDCYGTYGDDDMRGDAGHNSISGLSGNDQLSAGPGPDILHGGPENDQLSAGPGGDLLYGSIGTDSFRCGAGTDRIVDFNPSEGDTKSNDCENIGYSNHTGVSNETLTGLPANSTGFLANQTLSANNSSSQ